MKTFITMMLIVSALAGGSGAMMLVRQRDAAITKRDELNNVYITSKSVVFDRLIAFDVAMENSNRLKVNLDKLKDFADVINMRLMHCEMRASEDGRPLPIGKAPGWPSMKPMVRAWWWTNEAGMVVIQIKEVR